MYALFGDIRDCLVFSCFRPSNTRSLLVFVHPTHSPSPPFSPSFPNTHSIRGGAQVEEVHFEREFVAGHRIPLVEVVSGLLVCNAEQPSHFVQDICTNAASAYD